MSNLLKTGNKKPKTDVVVMGNGQKEEKETGIFKNCKVGFHSMILLRKATKMHILDKKIESSQGFFFAVRIKNSQDVMTATGTNQNPKRWTSMKSMLFLDIYQSR
jgi:hypothetical protein